MIYYWFGYNWQYWVLYFQQIVLFLWTLNPIRFFLPGITCFKVISPRTDSSSSTSPSLSQSNFSLCDTQKDNLADIKTAQIISILISRKLPETELEYSKFCREVGRNLDYLTNYTKSCLTSMAKQLMATALYSVRKTFSRTLCRAQAWESKYVKTLLGYKECIYDSRPKIKIQYNQYLDGLVGILTVNNEKRKIPMLCW